MKKQKRFMMLLVGVFLMFISMGTKAQTYSSKITGAAQVACNMFEFDLTIQRTGSTPLYLAMYQMGLNINSAIIPAGAQINISMVPGSSALSTNMKPTPDRFSFDATKNCIIMTAMSPAYANRTSISNAPAGTRVARFRVTCSQAFNPGVATNPTWAWSMAVGYQCKVFAYVGTINTDITVQASHYLVTPYSTTLTNSSPVTPAVSSISSDITEVCTNPGNGAVITVDATTNYCSYYLYRDGVQVPGTGGVAYGNGGPVAFGAIQTNGVFTVKSPSCSGLVDMGNDVTIVGLTPLVQTITLNPSATMVHPGDTVSFTTTTENSGPSNWYDWFVEDVNQSVYDPTFKYASDTSYYIYADVNSDGSLCISLATQLALSQTYHIYVGTDPILFDLTGGTTVCQGATPAITLSGSEVGFDYQLFKDGIAYQAPKPGDGFPLVWTVSAAGTYTCKIVFPDVAMNLAPVIVMNPILAPTFTQVPPICEGGALAPLPTTSNNGVTGTWAPALNNMATTEYTFTPTAGECATPATMTIVVNAPVVPTFAPVAPICAGATLDPLPNTSINGVTGTWAPAMNNMLTTEYTFTPTVGLCATTATLTVVVNDPTVPSFAPVAPICAGATLDPLPTTSINGVTGTWAPAMNNMVTTLYTFTPTAGLCATSTTLTVVVNDPTVPSFAPVAPICAGATLDPLPTTSINGVTGTWAPAMNNMVTTEYTFTPTAGLCATAATLTVVVNDPVAPSFAPVAPICAGAILDPLPTTSINGVTGTWAPALDNMVTTLYTFTPTAGLCATTATLTIVVNDPVAPSFAPVAPICAGATLDPLPTTSINGVTGTWAPALDNMNTTLYTFTPTAGLCATTATMTIVVNPYPAAAGAISGAASVTEGNSNVPYSVGPIADATSYVWAYTGTGVTINGVGPAVTLDFAMGATAGQLSVKGVNACGNGVSSFFDIFVELSAQPPLSFEVLGDGAYCEGGAGLPVSLAGSELGVTYDLYLGAAVLATQPGTGAAIPFGVFAAGTYEVKASKVGFLNVPMPGSAIITMNLAPLAPVTLTPNLDVCANALPATLIDVVPMGIQVNWYDAEIGGNLLVANSATYNSSTAGTFWNVAYDPITECYSLTRTPSVLTISPVVTPTFDPIASICAGTTLAPLPTTSLNGVAGTWAPALNNMLTTLYTFTPTGGCASTATMTIVVDPMVTPTFTQVAPITTGGTLAPLPNLSNNGIFGTWAPAMNNMVTTTYTFTPSAGQCASTTTMQIQVIPLVDEWSFSGDIGTTIQVTWPTHANTDVYGFQYRPYGSSAPWVGISSVLNSVKVGNLIPGQHYEIFVKAYKFSTVDNKYHPYSGGITNHFTTTPTTYSKDMDMGSALKVMWDDYSPWASSYKLQYKKVGDPSFTTVAVGNMPTIKINTEPGANYVAQVVVYHNGSLWGTTAPYAFTADSYSYAVTNKTGATLDLTWTDFNLGDASSPWVLTQYLRYRVAGSTGAWTQKTITGGVFTYHLTGLALNTNYEFQIHVYQPVFWGSTPLGTFNTTLPKSVDASITNNSINIYPNPFLDKVNMDLFTEQGTTVTWNIYDMTGKVVLSGNESITSGYSTLNIDGANLPKGVYMLNAIMNDQMQSFRILKQ